MARPAKTNVDYFPHMTHSGKTIAILEARWGNDGYAFWFKLLELLGDSNDFAFHCSRSADWEYLLSKTRVTEPVAQAILDKLAEVEAIDADCWRQKIVWSDNFFRNLEPVFEKRKGQKPQKPEFPQPKLDAAEVSGDCRDGNCAEPGLIPTETDKVNQSNPNQSNPNQCNLDQSNLDQIGGDPNEAKEHEPKEPKEPTKSWAGAPARERATGSASEQPDDENDEPVAEAGPAGTNDQKPEGAPVLPEPHAAKSKGKRHGVTAAQQPCPSSLRPSVAQQADTVYLTPDELEKLRREYGDEGAERMITLLDAYKTNNPEKSSKYRDDYKVIRSWVVRELRKELHDLQPGRRASPAGLRQSSTFIDKLADMAVED